MRVSLGQRVKRKAQATAADMARKTVALEIRERYVHAGVVVRMWRPTDEGDEYRRERRRLWGLALEAVERAK